MPKTRKRPSTDPDAAKKRRYTKDSEAYPLPAKASVSDLASRHRPKECGSEVERLAKELAESREKSSQLKGKLKVIEDAHSLEVTQFDFRIGELECDLRKTACSLLKAKEVKKANSSELGRLKQKTRLARIADSLDSLAVVHARDLALAGVEEGTSEVGEAPPSTRAEEATLSARRAELVNAEGDFDLILAGLKSERILPPCLDELEGQDPIAEEGGEGAVPNPEGVIGEGEAPRVEDD
ncbi:hypothetical protein DY000_02006631 [Brassica cretica]|uniref:Shugoshin C-terminal domain-containing protein n=1 Tax=Brassica cretica TaxID=69181 RepID=A0ABQ7CCM2_BRACR|nr:hypothetical protein DY000_02006631 [Brassica cretica]